MASPNYIPVEQNPLFVQNLTNITLTQTAYPAFFNASSNVNISALPNNLASLTFNATDPNLSWTLPLVSLVLNEDAVRMVIFCIYPISGAYDTLSRILFYILMVFSLVFQRHEKISMAALGTAMTYAAVSAIHALALATQFSGEFTDDSSHFSWDVFSAQKYTDPDMYGLFPILAVSGIMLTPILIWSSTVRDHNGHFVILCWGALILTALGVVLGTLLRQKERFSADVIPSFALCTNTSPDCYSYASNPNNSILFQKHIYETCGCMDFCSTYSPAAPMRRGSNMVALNTNYPNVDNSSTFVNLQIFGVPLMVFICISGILGLLQSKWSQEDIRNAIFTTLNGRHFAFLDDHWQMRRIRRLFVKCAAVLYFSIGLIVAALSPLVFIFAIAVLELLLQEYPQSEYSDAVGAWGTTVGATLVLLATILAAYQSLSLHYFRSFRGLLIRRQHTGDPNVESPTNQIKPLELCLEPLKRLKILMGDLTSFWNDPELECEERRRRKSEEVDIKDKLNATRIRQEEEILEYELQLRRSGTGAPGSSVREASFSPGTTARNEELHRNQIVYLGRKSATWSNTAYSPEDSQNPLVRAQDLELLTRS